MLWWHKILWQNRDQNILRLQKKHFQFCKLNGVALRGKTILHALVEKSSKNLTMLTDLYFNFPIETLQIPKTIDKHVSKIYLYQGVLVGPGNVSCRNNHYVLRSTHHGLILKFWFCYRPYDCLFSWTPYPRLRVIEISRDKNHAIPNMTVNLRSEQFLTMNL